MVSENDDTRRFRTAGETTVGIVGTLSLIAGLLFVFGSGSETVRGEAFLIFSGLCYVAAAIRSLESQIDKNRKTEE
jgi:hypothetical protein